jgi:uncharacterized protein YqgC (DUF456 family)
MISAGSGHLGLTLMFYLWATGLVVLNAFWLFLVVLGLPGNWLMILSTAVFAWVVRSPDPQHQSIGNLTLISLVVLATLGEILEFVAGVFGSRQAGGTRGGAVGALVGGIVGAIIGTFIIPIPVLGSLLGACGGAFTGALSFELAGGLDMEASVRSGIGAGVGRFFGTVAKAGMGVAIWLIAAVAVFWP